jgi:hypothetical protein
MDKARCPKPKSTLVILQYSIKNIIFISITHFSYLMIKRIPFLMFPLLLCGCTENIITPYDKTVPVILEIFIYNPDYENWYNRYIEEVYSGRITFVSYKHDIYNYDVTNTRNLIEVPFGFHNAYIHDFSGFSNDSLQVIALGGYDTLNLKAYISQLPDYMVEIINDSIQYGEYLYLYLKAPFHTKTSRIEFYGSDDTLSTPVQFLESWYVDFYEDSIGSRIIADIYEDKIYKYYNVSAAPYAGYDTITSLSKWYRIKSVKQ